MAAGGGGWDSAVADGAGARVEEGAGASAPPLLAARCRSRDRRRWWGLRLVAGAAAAPGLVIEGSRAGRRAAALHGRERSGACISRARAFRRGRPVGIVRPAPVDSRALVCLTVEELCCFDLDARFDQGDHKCWWVWGEGGVLGRGGGVLGRRGQGGESGGRRRRCLSARRSRDAWTPATSLVLLSAHSASSLSSHTHTQKYSASHPHSPSPLPAHAPFLSLH